MALYIPDDYAQVNVLFTVDGLADERVVTFGVNIGTVDPAAVADEVNDAMTAATGPVGDDDFISDLYNYVGVRAYTQTPSGMIVSENSTTVVGTLAGDPPSPQVAILANKVTVFGGRRNRGRLFLPPYMVLDTHVNGRGELDGTRRTLVEDKWQVLLTGLAAATMEMVIFHTPSIADPTPAPTPVSDISVQTRVATQRRRLR